MGVNKENYTQKEQQYGVIQWTVGLFARKKKCIQSLEIAGLWKLRGPQS